MQIFCELCKYFERNLLDLVKISSILRGKEGSADSEVSEDSEDTSERDIERKIAGGNNPPAI